MKLMRITKLLILSLLIFSFGCDDDDPFFVIDFSTVPPPIDVAGIEPVVSPSGLITFPVKQGSGPFEVILRDQIAVFITMRRESNGEVLFSSFANGATLSTVVPVNLPSTTTILFPDDALIEAFLGMKVGEIKVVKVPPSLAFGDRTRNEFNFNLRNETLVFEIELDEILN